MKKQDVMPGMAIEYKCGKRALVLLIRGQKVFSTIDGYMDAMYYTNNLKFITDAKDDEWDIDKVYEILYTSSIEDMLKDESLNLLWQRSKEIVLTMDEIAEKFGCNVEQLKIVKG